MLDFRFVQHRRLLAKAATVAAILITLGAVRMDAQSFIHVGDNEAVVEKKRVVIAFPMPYYRIKAPDPAVIGHYVWRISVEEGKHFSVVLAADTAMRTGSFKQIVRASTLRLCPEKWDGAALGCTQPLSGSADVVGDMIWVSVEDSTLVARLRTARPVMFWRYVMEPGGRYAVQRMKFFYDDK